ncbi:hypothetical protein S40293_01188 [Stachybotrys chartarum IBT 40293]|nr:hypothetical protein S40293_01188 [Stachybotrys chartarum IBT 40293]KFA81222.1 hypothetical protein S40288_07878 [Stachybotrys chartarum IBT 40288]
MKAVLVLALQALAVQAVRIVQSNDDGWAELYLRTFNDALRASGHDVIVSAPADNQSGTGNGPTGHNATRPDLNWVNSFPATSMRYGLDRFGPERWNAPADLAVSGPNYVTNLWLAVHFSGTVGAAVYAAHEAGVPAIAFSADSPAGGSQPWNLSPRPSHSLVYGELATQLVDKLIASGRPYLPDDVWLNVNFPAATGACSRASDFRWVLSRINIGLLSSPDVEWCGSERLPHEQRVFDTNGCYIPISIGDASDRSTVNDVARQAIVLDKLRDILTCLP